MFLKLPFHGIPHNLQTPSFLLNTVLLIAALITVELVYSEQPKFNRQHLKYFYPLFIVLVGLLVYAAIKQTSGAS